MQDKETVDDPEEALTNKAEQVSDRQVSVDKKDSLEGNSKKESTKDGKFAFRKMKQPRKEKSDKKSSSRFDGEGVIFKAKLIGVESVPEPRGDKMCQDAMQKLKMNVRNISQHKRKILISVSLQGIKIKDEKFGNVIYHHPVSLISFISQDITDARAFGYVFGSTDEPHQFIAIKTEKPAFHVVVALRDLFQTVLNYKKEEIDTAKDSTNGNTEKQEKSTTSQADTPVKIPVEEEKPKDENIYFEVLLTEPFKMKEEETEENQKDTEPVKTVDDLLGLQNELTKLQEGINQMDTSIAAAAAFNSEIAIPENDPFDTSFVLGPKRDSFPMPMPTPIPPVSATPVHDNHQMVNPSNNEDKYAVFNAINTGPSVFETASAETFNESDQTVPVPDLKELEEEITKKTPPAKPPRSSKSTSPDQSIFADLDPLGKDRPYKDKTEFFQDVKNPPKKVLNDLVDPNKENKAFDMAVLSSVPFPVDFESTSPPAFVNSVLSSSLPNTFSTNSKLSLANTHYRNGENAYNPFDKQEMENIKNNNPPKLRSQTYDPAFPNAQVMQQNLLNNPSYLNKLPTQTLNLNNTQLQAQQTMSSSPIPIPSRQNGFNKDRSVSNGSTGSPYSKSPLPFNSESPNHSDYYTNGHTNSESPCHFINRENDYTIPPPINNSNKHASNGLSNNHNGMSRPRPRPSLTKGSSLPNNGHTLSSNSVSSDSSSDYEAISRESMQSITNVLLTNGHRLRAQSLCLESNNEFRLQLPNENNIFAKKNDPFADDFFFSLPKKNGHLTKTEIPEYV